MQHSGGRETFTPHICHKLEVYTAIEEALFYAALRNPDSGSEMPGIEKSGRRTTLSQSLEKYLIDKPIRNAGLAHLGPIVEQPFATQDRS